MVHKSKNKIKVIIIVYISLTLNSSEHLKILIYQFQIVNQYIFIIIINCIRIKLTI